MRETELVFIPTPAIGHLPPTVEFAKLLLQHDDSISILVLIFNLRSDTSMVNPYIDYQSSIVDPTRLTFLTLPPLSAPPDHDDFNNLIELNKPLVKRALDDRVTRSSNKPACFVLDMLCIAMVDVANELQIPSYVFFSSGASFLSLMFHSQSLADEYGIDYLVTQLSDPDNDLDIPGFRSRVPSKVMPSVFLHKGGGSQWVTYLARRLREAKGILVNSFTELESYAIQTLRDHHSKIYSAPKITGNNAAIYPVGPIIKIDGGSRLRIQKEDEEMIMTWLDEQPSHSVVFLSFGSMGSFSDEQVKEIASGLDRSGHRFLWSLRRPPSKGIRSGFSSQNEAYIEALPEGFLNRTTQRGRIIGWAPQISILGHRAVGGFVSHCGWNSTLESLWFGKPMATWPVYSEQQLNAFLLVKELELAVEIRMDYCRNWKSEKANFVVVAEEVENGVRKLMNMDEEMRGKIKEMSEKGREALLNGESHDYLKVFIRDIMENSSFENQVRISGGSGQ